MTQKTKPKGNLLWLCYCLFFVQYGLVPSFNEDKNTAWQCRSQQEIALPLTADMKSAA